MTVSEKIYIYEYVTAQLIYNTYQEGSSKIFHQDYIDNEVTSKAEEEKLKVESPIDTIVIVNENEIEPLTNPQANVEQENVNNAKVENRKNLDGDETEPLLPKSNSKQVGYIEEIIFLLFTIPSWAGDVVSFLLALILVSFPGEYKDRTMEFLKDFFEADRWWKKLVLILTFVSGIIKLLIDDDIIKIEA
ncbi:unnamed protein product [Rhizophagus irregularis]|uniref:Uncharacterized protein n=1 Tax=Rhizophagus irregularis TaxID=588596 RepID=A0A915ZUG8_9GLOM|nr:unnamed protein product [Rhizophagus irregularis]CAB5209396.1 unnamed protein product [Rhizophagus irregularis]CAB5388935.1 unnamed protein product [Rhizophagus irregularis]